jgi:hypothetical protein
MKRVKSKAQAPRLQAYIQKTQGVLVMPRNDWNVLKVNSTNLVEIEVQAIPISRVVTEASVLAVVARNSSNSDARVSVYRKDIKDQPKSVNVDHYEVWLDLANHPEIDEMIVGASTSLDANLRQYLDENVFLVREQRGDDHWLEKLPDSVEVVINVCTTST